jgi:hypothetical protein
MRQSLAELEREFHHQTERERRRGEQLRRQAARRARRRRALRTRRRGSVRFWMLAVSLVLTAAAVTAAMFTTLYLLLS